VLWTERPTVSSGGERGSIIRGWQQPTAGYGVIAVSLARLQSRNKEIKSSTVDQHYFPMTNLRNIFAGPSCAKIAIGRERSAQQNRVA